MLYLSLVSEKVLLEAIKAPYKTILENAGIEDYEVPKVKRKRTKCGYRENGKYGKVRNNRSLTCY